MLVYNNYYLINSNLLQLYFFYFLVGLLNLLLHLVRILYIHVNGYVKHSIVENFSGSNIIFSKIIFSDYKNTTPLS